MIVSQAAWAEQNASGSCWRNATVRLRRRPLSILLRLSAGAFILHANIGFSNPDYPQLQTLVCRIRPQALNSAGIVASAPDARALDNVAKKGTKMPDGANIL